MEWFVKAFLKASLTWLALGVTLGVTMAAHPEYTIYRPAHAHMVLFGFVTMMIFGVAHHVVPRFTGHPIHNRRAAEAQWFISNAGLVFMVAGFVLRANGASPGGLVLAAGGILAAVGAYTFVYNIWRTIDGPRELREQGKAASRVELPLAS